MVLSLLQIKEQVQAAQQAFRKAASNWLMQQPLPLGEREKWQACFASKTRESLLTTTRQNELPLVANDFEAHPIEGEETTAVRPPAVRRQYVVNGDAFYEQFGQIINLYEWLLRAEEILGTVPQLINLEDLSYFTLLAGNMDRELNKAPENVDVISDYQRRLTKARHDFAVADREANRALSLYKKQHQDCQSDFIDALMLIQNQLQMLYQRYPNTSFLKYLMYDNWQSLLIDTSKALFGRLSCEHASVNTLTIQNNALNELIESAEQGRARACHQLESEVEGYKDKIKGALSSAELKLGGMVSRMKIQDQLVQWRTPLDPALGLSMYVNSMFGFWRVIRGNGWIHPRMLALASDSEADAPRHDSNTQVVPS